MRKGATPCVATSSKPIIPASFAGIIREEMLTVWAAARFVRGGSGQTTATPESLGHAAERRPLPGHQHGAEEHRVAVPRHDPLRGMLATLLDAVGARHGLSRDALIDRLFN